MWYSGGTGVTHSTLVNDLEADIDGSMKGLDGGKGEEGDKSGKK